MTVKAFLYRQYKRLKHITYLLACYFMLATEMISYLFIAT